MLDPRHFVYKRAHHARANSPVLGVGGSDSDNAPGSTPATQVFSVSPVSPVSPASPSPPPSPDPVEPLTAPAPSPKTSDPAVVSLPAPSTPASQTMPSASSLAAPSSSASSASSSSASSASAKTSSAAATPLVAAPVTTAYSPLTTHVNSISPASSAAATPSTTSTSGTSGGTNTTVIVGAIAGTLAGIAVLGFLLMWCMRRQRSRDADDDFDAQAFKRQSAILVDDPTEPPRSYNPRPPTMIEHHNASPALASQAGYGGQNFYGNYGGYGQQAPLDMTQPAGSPPQAYGAPPMGYAGYDDPQLARQPSNPGYPDYTTLARQPSDAQYLTRQPSSGAAYVPVTAPPASLDANASYVDLNRSSVSPYQAAQYAAISRQLGAPNPNELARPVSQGLPEGLLPSPFDDPTEPAPAASVSSGATASGQVTAAPQAHGNAAGAHQRPTTVYEEGDAYGGI